MSQPTVSTPRFNDEAATRAVRLSIRPTAGERAAVVDRMRRYRFVFVTLGEARGAAETLEFLAETFELGEPFVPEAYRSRRFDSPLSDIRKDASSAHPGFATDAGQPMHVDGLLESLGTVRTSLLHCVRQAVTGGRTILFDACGVFDRLRAEDPPAADALLAGDVLERFATIPGVHESSVGPAFEVDESGRTLCRFSDGPTERWHPGPGHEDDLERGLSVLRREAASDGPYRISVPLRPGETLIFANDRLSHGREAFVDDPRNPRHLVRALHTTPFPAA
ncbi:TauD/TfdA family dioxygenase [Streptosporangium sp. NPDC051022]|uniref:TauD/TfdA family dioxygenase n=1 Tax=Streptosporangium sp. NPDC051022 TaxID=3155752 RepID=UPI003429459F